MSARARTFLIVARAEADAVAVAGRLVHEPRQVVTITTDGTTPILDGTRIDEVVWVDGWRAGRHAGHAERLVWQFATCRSDVVACEAAP